MPAVAGQKNVDFPVFDNAANTAKTSEHAQQQRMLTKETPCHPGAHFMGFSFPRISPVILSFQGE